MRERGAGTTPPRDAGSKNHNIYMDCFAGYAVRTHREAIRADRLPLGGGERGSFKIRQSAAVCTRKRIPSPATITKKEDLYMSLMICTRCGATYRTEDTRRRYCSEECRHAAILENKARYRAKKKAKAGKK